jgi:hypothetical protein
MTQPRSPSYGVDARLDDLLTAADPGPPASPPPARSWVGRLILQAGIASGAIYLLFHIFNLAPAYPLILAVCIGVLAVRRAVHLTAEPQRMHAAEVVRPPGGGHLSETVGWYTGNDGMLAAVRRWERRFDKGVRGPEQFLLSVAPHLGELVDERLRQRHGITRFSHPDRARALLGEDIWIILHGPLPGIPTPRALAALVRRMENL